MRILGYTQEELERELREYFIDGEPTSGQYARTIRVAAMIMFLIGKDPSPLGMTLAEAKEHIAKLFEKKEAPRYFPVFVPPSDAVKMYMITGPIYTNIPYGMLEPHADRFRIAFGKSLDDGLALTAAEIVGILEYRAACAMDAQDAYSRLAAHVRRYEEEENLRKAREIGHEL